MTKPIVHVAQHAPLMEGRCRIIAEAGVNHDNSVDQALRLVEQASEAGAWAIKFQLYKAGSLSVRDAPKYWLDNTTTQSQYETFERADHLSYASYSAIADACRDLGIVFFATPFDFRAVDALEAINVPIYKIASGDITYKQLLKVVAETGKPLLMSTGAATADEIDQAIEWLELGPDKLVLLACTLAYPTPATDGHFARLESFRKRFAPYLVGMSDHTLGVPGAWMTAALGGVCIEKHYTLDRSLPDSPDHRISVETAELEEMVEACDTASTLRGTSDIGVRESELPARTGARRSIVLAHDVEAGAEIQRGDLAFKRPGKGMPPAMADRLVGRRVSHELFVDHILTNADFDDDESIPE